MTHRTRHDMEHDMIPDRLSICLTAWKHDDDRAHMVVWVHHDPADPWNVRVEVAGSVVSFEVPRAILAAGHGESEDMQVQPSARQGFDLWTLGWTPEGPVTLRVPNTPVQDLLQATSELTRVDWDQAAEELFEHPN